MPKVRVETPDCSIALAEHEQLTFGRARDCLVCLDPADTAISRIAGSVHFEQGTWWIANKSETRPLSLVDDLGFRGILPPRRRAAVEGAIQVIVEGTRGQHCIRVAVEASPAAPGDATPMADKPGGMPTATGTEVMISASDRLAMVALFAGYLEDPPRYDPYPKSYAAAAARLGWNRTALVKRIEYLRRRLHAAGIPKMLGFSALANLAEYAISGGLITRDDLHLLRQPIKPHQTGHPRRVPSPPGTL
jgi:hypothetical protein